MPSSDYTSAIGGGLKLKGAKDAGVKKKKKSKKGGESKTVESGEGKKIESGEGSAVEKAWKEEDDGGDMKVGEEEVRKSGKTEAQRRFEETRRKRLDERLQKEGIKTHKERVEALNSYLSGLSEHHDMPRIGPG